MNAQQSHKLRTCLWMVYTLRRCGHLTLRQIGERWQADTDISDGNPLPRSTFNDYRTYISDLFGISIVCDQRTRRYSLQTDQSDTAFLDWLLSSFSITRLAGQTQQVRQHILLDRPPVGMQHFDTVVQAFSAACCLSATYRKFGDEAYPCHLRPYALKPYKGRWYLLAQKDDEPRIKCFALDRFEQMQVLPDEPFSVPSDFDAQAYFDVCIGIYRLDTEPETIQICAHGQARHYLRLSPLHPSQSEQPLDADASLFTLRCQHTPDLVLAILAHGSLVHVVRPEALRNAVHAEARALLARYEEASIVN